MTNTIEINYKNNPKIQWLNSDRNITGKIIYKFIGDDLSTISLDKEESIDFNDIEFITSDQNIATVDITGNVTIINKGIVTISAVFNGNDNYNPKTVSFKLNINEIVKLNPNFKWKQGQLNFINNSAVNITCKKNDIITSIYLEKPNDILEEDIIFTSSDSNVAEILNNGEIIVYAFGETTISASFNGDDKYINVDEISFTLITNELKKKTPDFVWKCGDENIDSVLHKTLLDRSDDIYLVKPYQILLTNITYSSSNENVAVIDESGRIYIEGVGYTIITASFSGDDLYKPKDNIWFKLEIDDVSFDDNIEEKENNSVISTYKKTSKIKTINLGPYQYLYEYLKNDEDFHDLGCSDNFVILRNFEIINDVIYDKDIFFIEKTIYNKLIQNNSQNIVCYPLYKNGSLFFSNTHEFFTTYNVNIKDITYNVYEEINDNEEIEADILCDKLRIYNPVINKNLDFIIYVDNYINNIHFHYFCNLNKNFKKQYTGELKVNNNRYIEYIELNIPNIKKLFNTKNKYFIKEDFNKIAFEKDYSLDLHFYNLYKMQSNIEMFNQLYGNKLYLSKMIKPFMIDKLDIKVKDENQQEQIVTKNVKTYIDDKYFNYNSNYINTSLNITLYPYSNISNNLYILHDIIGPSSMFIPYENYFRLSSHLGFDNGIISLINEFVFPNKQKSNNVNRYEYNYDNSFIEYSDNINEYINQNQQENNQENNTNNEIDRQVTQQYNAYFLHESISNYDTRDEFDEDLDIEEIRSTGFVIQIALDINFEEIILESIINTDNPNNNFIYDFSFSLNDMVDSWDQLNDILIMRAKFIDKRLNIVITGNNVIITKEWFKYLVNDNKNYIIKFNTNNLIENMDTNYFNFIDHINCVITDETDKSISTINNSIANTKLVYKPIFYKVQDLQNIRIRQGVTQNIGVNLGEFINKVSTFMLNIDDQTIKESSRNDVFVIFSINANNIENNTGYYNILDDNFEYISSGNYIKY